MRELIVAQKLLEEQAPQREITKWADIELDKIYAADKVRKLGTKFNMDFALTLRGYGDVSLI